MRQAVILAGGKGTRLASRLAGRPKPLIDILGVPRLERQVLSLKAAGISRVLILVNHEAAQIESFCAEREGWGLDLEIVDDGAPRGTAGAVLHVLDRLEDDALIVYGDTLFYIDFARFLRAHDADLRATATLFLHPNDHPQDSDLVEVDSQGRIRAFHPYPHPAGVWRANMVNAALYAVRREALAPWRARIGEGVVDFAKDLFPALLIAGASLGGYVSPEYIKDVGTPDRVDRACADLASGHVARASLGEAQPAVFLDRDGVLNRPNGHIATPEALEVFAFAPEAVRRLNRAGLRTVLVTNQPVIARGDCTEAELGVIHAKLETVLGQEGAYLDRIYYCPHHPDGGFAGEVASLKIACDCRKPRPGMILKARDDLNIDLAASWMIGDSLADVRAAKAAGATSIFVRSGARSQADLAEALSDFAFDTVLEAARFITDVHARRIEAAAPVLADRLRLDPSFDARAAL